MLLCRHMRTRFNHRHTTKPSEARSIRPEPGRVCCPNIKVGTQIKKFTTSPPKCAFLRIMNQNVAELRDSRLLAKSTRHDFRAHARPRFAAQWERRGEEEGVALPARRSYVEARFLWKGGRGKKALELESCSSLERGIPSLTLVTS